MHAITEPCPNCGSWDVRFSRFRVQDALGLLNLNRPLRCEQCRERFWTRLVGARVPKRAHTTHAADDAIDLVIRIRRPSRWLRSLLAVIGDPGHSRLE